MDINSVAFLGSSDALKPKIIIEQLKEYMNNSLKTFSFIGEKDSGKCLDYVRQINMKYEILNSVQIDQEDISKLDQYDLIICLGWPHIIKSYVLQQTKSIFINCHGSFLPDYRGSRAYMHYWANVSPYIGASVHYITEGVDDGAILVRNKMKLFPEDTLEMAHYRSCELSAQQIPYAISLIENNCKGFIYRERARYFFKCSAETILRIREQNMKTYPRRTCSTQYKIIDNREERILFLGNSDNAYDIIEDYSEKGYLTIHLTDQNSCGSNADVHEIVEKIEKEIGEKVMQKWNINHCVSLQSDLNELCIYFNQKDNKE